VDFLAESKYLTMKEVRERVRLSRSTIYRKMNKEEFPSPFQFSDSILFWKESEIEQWLESRPRRRTPEVVRLDPITATQRGLRKAS
jgi:prophage regulatory protein